MRVRVGDIRLYVEVLGPKLVQDGWNWRSRPTLILIHGGPGFDHLAYRQGGDGYVGLDRSAQVVLVDLRGCGASDASTPQDWNLATWASDVVELCCVLGIDRPVILGESGGGYVALEVLRQAPTLAAGVALANTSAKWSLDRVVEAFGRRGGIEAADIARSFWTDPTGPAGVEYGRVCMPLYQGSVSDGSETPEPARAEAPRDPAPEPPRLRYNHSLLAHFTRSEMQKFDYLETLATTASPVLLIAGEQDPVCPVEDSDDIAAVARNLTYHRVRGAGHTVAHDDPDLFRTAVLDFMRMLGT